jgi:putative phosphoesterase
MKVGIIADTHIPGVSSSLPKEVKAAFVDVDLILHAGDIYTSSVLDELEELAPVLAAKGDDDYATGDDRRVQESHILTLGGLTVHLVHKMPTQIFRAWMGAEMETGEANQGVGILIFGHTHCDLISKCQGILLINPGSPTFPKPPSALGTVGILKIESREAEPLIIQL